jgi:hypothetical protein
MTGGALRDSVNAHHERFNALRVSRPVSFADRPNTPSGHLHSAP